jgi:hypothetical protein
MLFAIQSIENRHVSASGVFGVEIQWDEGM